MIIDKAKAAGFDFGGWNLSTLFKGKDAASLKLEDICCGKESIVLRVTQLAIDLFGWITFIILIYASIMYLISYGDEGRAEVAKKTILWSITGVLIAAFSHWIIGTIYNILK